MMNGMAMSDTSSDICDLEKFSIIVCCNPSYHDEDGVDEKVRVRRIEIADDCDGDDDNDDDDGKDDEVASEKQWYYYSPGVADDDTTWRRNSTPKLFWSNM
jgi:hypothetical protein